MWRSSTVRRWAQPPATPQPGAASLGGRGGNAGLHFETRHNLFLPDRNALDHGRPVRAAVGGKFGAIGIPVGGFEIVHGPEDGFLTVVLVRASVGHSIFADDQVRAGVMAVLAEVEKSILARFLVLGVHREVAPAAFGPGVFLVAHDEGAHRGPFAYGRPLVMAFAHVRRRRSITRALPCSDESR